MVLLWQGMDHKIPIRRQFRQVTILRDYQILRREGNSHRFPVD